MAVQYKKKSKRSSKTGSGSLSPIAFLVIGIIAVISFLSEYIIYIILGTTVLLVIYAIIHGLKKPVNKSPKATSADIAQAENLMRQLSESTALLNKTNVAKTFFGRLHFTLDILLELQKYEKYNLFSNSTPTQDYEKILSNLEATVNDFIDRSISSHIAKHEHLKTQKAKDRNLYKHISSLLSDFEDSDTFWQGNNMYPHYSGPLYTDSNYQRIKAMYDDLYRKVEINLNS